MLKTMRNSFHHLKWTLFAVIGVFILGFVFWSGSNGAQKNSFSQVSALMTVNSAGLVRPK